MWFKPLQELVGDIVNYESDSDMSDNNDSEDSDDNIERSGVQITNIPKNQSSMLD